MAVAVVEAGGLADVDMAVPGRDRRPVEATPILVRVVDEMQDGIVEI
jgi:hypothetical protein